VSQSPTDPFDTASLRAAVLDAWRSSPTRYREDANVEEDYALGGYRDRLVIELAQNAADAARAAGVPGRILFKVADDGLVVANTGAPIDLAGVQSMAAMRASAKGSDATVGRFGVGFAAVLAITDAPAIASRDVGVRFSRHDSAELMRHDASLADLVADRQPPVLRLPFSYDTSTVGRDSALDAYDTVVVLPWRDSEARGRAVEALAAVDDALFIALPDLVELVIENGESDVAERWTASRDDDVLSLTVNGRNSRWQLHRSTGAWSDTDRSHAAAEVRSRQSWSLTWAVPVTSEAAVARWPADSTGRSPAAVVHAPTPTDEPLAFPALLVGDFPVDATRRRLQHGAMTDVMLDAAVERYVDVVRAVSQLHGVDAVKLVPNPDLVGPVDGRLRDGVREQLSRTPWVPRASDRTPASPSELVTVEPAAAELVAVLAPHVSDLVAPEWMPHVSTLRGLGLTSRTWPDVWDVVARVDVGAETWHAIYAAASDLGASSLEGMPVLLGGGRIVRDARRCVAPSSEATDADLQALGLAVVDRVAMHPLLERLGTRSFEPVVHLGAAFVSQVEGAAHDDPLEARELVSAAAAALASSGVLPGQIAGLGAVLVPTESGDWLPAARTVLPGTPMAELAADAAARDAAADVMLDATLAADHRDGWLALGVLGALTVVAADETPLDPELWDQLMVDGGAWCDEVAAALGVRAPGELFATTARIVRGLEHVDGADLARVLPLLSAPDVRSAIIEPTLVLDAAGRTRSVPSPAAWWLSEAPLFDGEPATAVRLPGDQRLAPFFSAIDAAGVDVSGGDGALLQAIGVHSSLEQWLDRPEGVSALLASMARAEVAVPNALVPQLYRAITDADPNPNDVEVPSSIRARLDGRWQVVDADEVVVARAPHHAAVTRAPFVPGDEALAELLDVDTTNDTLVGAVELRSEGVVREVPSGAASLVGITHYREHDSLTVGGTDVDWWVSDNGEVHACTVDGLARGLAWASGQWGRRWEFEAKLSGVDDAVREDLDACYDA
jgi:hypothetical protein